VEGKVSVLQRPDLRLDAGADLTEFTKNLHKRSDSDMSLGSTKDVKASWKESKGSKKAEGGIFDQQPGHERFIRALGPGEYFGEVSLIYDTERTATVRSQSAGGACRVFQLRRQHYVMAQAAAQEALSRERRKLVSGVALLKGLETELLHRVVDMLEAETKRAGELIFEKGEFGDKLYIVESGEVSIVIDGKEVRRFHAGDYFGEVALLNENSTRTANALVAEGSATARLLSVQRDNFESILGPLKVAMHSSALAQIPFFAPLSPDQISDLAQCLQLRKFTAGATVIKAGEVDDAIYLVAQGSLEEESNAQFKRSLFPAGSLRRQAAVNNSGSSLPPTPGSSADGVSPGGTVFRRVLNKGDYFGEAALLTQEPGGLTVRSLDLSSILSLSKVDIQKKVGSLVQLQQAWRRNAVEAWAKQAKETLANDGVNIAVSSADIDVIIEELEVGAVQVELILPISLKAPGFNP
jgi:CRP-like cAMP-binding protein